MNKFLRIVFTSLILSSVAFFCTAEGSQESGTPDTDRPMQKMERPSESQLTLLRLQYFTENADTEPALALSAEQAKLILPVLEDWSNAIEADESAGTDDFTADINEVLSSEQSSYLPQPPENGRPSGDSDGQRPEKGQRPERGQTPPGLSVSDLLAELTDKLSAMI